MDQFGNPSCHKINQLLKLWLEELDASGIDLMEYGRIERALWEQEPMRKDFPGYDPLVLDEDPLDSDEPFTWRLINFTFGASPSDWHVWGSQLDGYAGEFWSMVERPEVNMPGTWIE